MIERLGVAAIRVGWHYMALSQLLWNTITSTIYQIIGRRVRLRETMIQCYAIGVESLPIMMTALLFIGVMLTVEFSYHMKLVIREDSLVPAFSTVLMVREMGPVVTCLLLASRIGAGIAAEIGTMAITDQLDVLRLMRINLVEFLTVPRWVACVFAAVSLSIISVAVALLGGAGLAAAKLGYLPSEFFNSMFTFTHPGDFVAAMIKAVVFGTIIPIVATRHGLNCRANAQGVGDAATSAVVESSVLIIVADFFVTYLWYAL